ncbi:mediator complex subunit MED7 [Cardiosporidium cionae]|uniref:Mediator of RNA polymerase II transcription subunit 7 n=1 Tax=Cardiosporidium cionae TaxID=476202 RepID=A0ABQ7JEY7_9APIC|nr:mediator complex subunit MED7 [Cardiosporidium cionae]|eukprot:KAF8822577.1 mediator complex subunit MED7 [Cardiosporidium cionae]
MENESTAAILNTEHSNAFRSGWPPPPFYYREYARGPKNGRPPPKPLDETWRLFGHTYTKNVCLEPLTSDIIMYSNKPGTDLKLEFRRLFSMYKEQLNAVMDSISNCRGEEKDEVKRLMKIYQNLMHILSRLREPQTNEDIINRLSFLYAFGKYKLRYLFLIEWKFGSVVIASIPLKGLYWKVGANYVNAEAVELNV